MKNDIATENVSWQNTVKKLAEDAEIATRQYGPMPPMILDLRYYNIYRQHGCHISDMETLAKDEESEHFKSIITTLFT